MQSIIERFERDVSKKADEDVAELQFLLTENTIKLVYHRDGARITASTREFETPPVGTDQALNLTFSSDITSSYQVCACTCMCSVGCTYNTLHDCVSRSVCCKLQHIQTYSPTAHVGGPSVCSGVAYV